MFPKAVVFHIRAINSDHNPLLIDTSPQESFSPRPFQFEAIWSRDPRCFEVIDKAWKVEAFGSACYKLYKKQFNNTITLQKWNNEVFG